MKNEKCTQMFFLFFGVNKTQRKQSGELWQQYCYVVCETIE